MNKIIKLKYILIITYLFSLSLFANEGNKALHYKNIIDRTGTPKRHKDYDHFQNQKFNPL
jgi:putative isomerase